LAGFSNSSPVIGVVVAAIPARSGKFVRLTPEKSHETVVAGNEKPTWQSLPPGVAGSQTSSQMLWPAGAPAARLSTATPQMSLGGAQLGEKSPVQDWLRLQSPSPIPAQARCALHTVVPLAQRPAGQTASRSYP